MKTWSKSRTELFIQGFRKSKKTSQGKDNGGSKGGMIVLEKPSLDKDVQLSLPASDTLHFISSARSSISSLDTLVSIDSGIDCGTNSLGSVESFSDMMKEKDPTPGGRAPIASPEDDLLSDETIGKENKTQDYVDDTCSATFDLDDTASSVCTLSGNTSNCDSGSDSSDSESEDSLQRTPLNSDSESDSEGVKGRQRRISYSDTDSDSDDDQSSDFFTMSQSLNYSMQQQKDKSSKKLSRSTSKLNLSLKKLVRSGSKLDLSFKKLMKGASLSSLKGKKKKDRDLNITELQSSPRKVIPRKPSSGKKNVSKVKSQKMSASSKHPVNTSILSAKSTSFMSAQNLSIMSAQNTSVLSAKSKSAVMSVNSRKMMMDKVLMCDNLLQSDSDSSDSLRASVSSSSDSDYGGGYRLPNGRSKIQLGNRVKKLQHSKSDCSNKTRPALSRRSNLFEDDGGSRTVRQVLNNSPALKIRSQSFMQNPCDIDIDTCKSPMEVRQAMEKTAFWIENYDYDKTPDVSSTESLLQSSKDVTESDLCNQIIGIYFGEENDSDSSLSSSCLDNSLDTSFVPDENASPITSTPLETNLDDFTVAKFVPATYKTAEAKTRKIMQEAGSVNEVKHIDSRKEKKILKEKLNNPSKVSSNSSKTVSVHRNSKRNKMLSEEEIDTITKIHTICNGQRTVQYLDLNDLPMNFNHYPPPKRASRVAWNQDLYSDELIHHTPPPKASGQPRPILQQKPKDFMYPYQEDQPSPIVITKLRRSKLLPRKSKEWPW